MMQYQKMLNDTGERNCSERWDLIKQELPKEGVVLDIGSSEGFFVRAIANETNLLAISIENALDKIQYQKKWINEKNYIGKLILCNCKIDSSITNKLVQTCEWIDVILLLSCLHWMSDHKKILKDLSQMSSKIIIELPQENDRKAVGQHLIYEIGNVKEYLEQTTKREVRHLAMVKAHTSEYRDLWIIEGNIKREPKLPYYDCRNIFSKYKQEWNGDELKFQSMEFRQNKWVERSWLSGINLYTLSKLRCFFPVPKVWLTIAKKELEREKQLLKNYKGDCQIWNIIVRRNGIKWIDLEHFEIKKSEEECMDFLYNCLKNNE